MSGNIKLDVSALTEKRQSLEFTVPAQDIDLGSEGIILRSDVRMTVVADNDENRLELTGRIVTEAETVCSRCLKPIIRVEPIEFDVRYVKPEDFGSDEESEVESEDLLTDILTSDEIDITEVAREQLLLDIPVRIYCQEDCRGLCEKCGADLNLIDCKCSDNEIDPRWAALKNIG
ncbi:MAG: DUF177 domain-containing protein [Acidobacteria bacterium]|nr:DUF177 domain-containing protein [Acidobacteriota bacterium]